MTNGKGGHSGRVDSDGGLKNALRAVPGRMLSALILPALPLLSLHRDALPIIRTALQRDKDEYIRAIDKFLFFELHALAMVLDPKRKLRGGDYGNLEKDLAIELSQIIDKSMATVVSLVEIQEIILSRIIEALNETKNGRMRSHDDGQPVLAGIVADGKAAKADDAAGHLTTSSLLNTLQGKTREMVLSRLLDLFRSARGRVILAHLAEILTQRDGSKQQKSGKNGADKAS